MNMGNRMSGNFSREEISFMGGNFSGISNNMQGNFGDGNNLGGMSHRMQSGMNNPSFEGNSGHRAGPMRSGMDRDFRGESRRSESSSFVIGEGDDEDVEEIMEDDHKFTGGFSNFGNNGSPCQEVVPQCPT